MDSALILRSMVDSGQKVSSEQVKELLDSSPLVKSLTAEFLRKPLYAIWRIIALSEIPHTSQLAYTQDLITYIEKHLATPSGFSLTGRDADLVPCYNAMLAEAYAKLGLTQMQSAQNAINWIKQFQPFERGVSSTWTEKGINKYGGCLKTTPCYLGIAKSLKALSYYNRALEKPDKEIDTLLISGMNYVLKHELYKRLSTKEPINKHILDLSFPPSYQLNVVELLELAFITGNLSHSACQSALDHIHSKRNKAGYWKINYAYKGEGYMTFDQRGSKAEWLTYFLNSYSKIEEEE